MKRTLLTTLLTLFAAAAFAQRGGVTATVVDADTGESVVGAVLTLTPVKTPEKKQYFTSAFKGAVSIPSLAYGEYSLSVAFLGYNNLDTTFRVSASKVSLGLLKLKPGVQIETVVKEAKALRTSQKGDTVSYNAGAFKVVADADVEGLLKKMPGITVTDGTVEAQGETVKKVFVDGKEFFGEDVTTAIKSLPAEAVDRVEVYNKLSDAAEFSGMDDGEGYKALNIVTRPGMRQGQFGKLYAGFGYDADTETEDKFKYIAGGNANVFSGDSRISFIGLFNNVNQQNFSFEDILGVSGGGGGRRGGMGNYMVRPQSGVASVNAIGVNYSDTSGQAQSSSDVPGQLFLQQHQYREPFDGGEMVRGPDDPRYAVDQRLFRHEGLQPPVQRPSGVENLREPEPDDPPALQLPVQRSVEQHDRMAVRRTRRRRQRLQPHGQLQRRPAPRLQRRDERRLPGQAGQERPHDHP